MNLTNEIKEMILKHAAEVAPQESCGLLVQDEQSRLHYLPFVNSARNKDNEFVIHADDWLIAEKMGEVVAVVHSHNNGKPYLSSHDRSSQLATKLTWLLVCDGKIYMFPCVPRLLGREFIYGKQDCAALVRDAYFLAGATIQDYERGDLIEDAKQKRLIGITAENNFERVPFANEQDSDLNVLQAGDALVFTIGSEACHAAIYLGDGYFMHHINEQLSRREFLNGSWRASLHSVWRQKGFKPENIQGVLNDLEA